MIVAGIDPGLDGGVALLHGKDFGCTSIWTMPTKAGAKKGRDIDCQNLKSMLSVGRIVIDLAMVESVHAMPKQGVSSSFTFGMGYGKILGVLECLGIPYQLVTPQQWKKVILAGLGREKSDAIRWCRNRFPMVRLKATPSCTKDHDGMAEALCLAEYARLVLAGKR